MTGTLHDDQYTFLILSRLILRKIKNVSYKIVQKIKTCILCPVFQPPPQKKNRAVYEVMWRNLVGLDRPQMTM